MKNPILALLLLMTMAACSSSDDNSPDNPSENIFLPLTDDNYWTYDVSGTALSVRDSLYVANDTVISGTTYKKMKARAIAIGQFTRSLHLNAVRKVNSSIVVNGTAGFNFANTLPFSLELNDFVMFRENATAGTELSSVSGTIEQTLQGYPLILQYTYKSTAMDAIPAYSSPNGDDYTDVKAVKLTLSLGISTTVTVGGFNVNVPILLPQDVIVSDQYYAKNIGMVHAQTTIGYDLESFAQFGITLPFPPSASEIQHEYLDTYQAD
jgi:hypothetical protein